MAEEASLIEERYKNFFRTATSDSNSGKGHDPYPFQTRLATGEKLPELIDIPTGLGKTDAVVLAWLWRRRFAGEQVRRATPRRLVYCLPMRTLVEQTEEKARMWLSNLGLFSKRPGSTEPADTGNWSKWAEKEGPESDKTRISVTVLMGGEDKDDWDLYPERDAIIIGTQDMLLSRALNRGYGMSRYRWPVHFGLLNNDCLWVMDEVQLMGVGVETSAQLQAFCRSFGIMNPVQYIWMSATVGEKQLETVDHPKPHEGWTKHFLDCDEKNTPEVKKRVQAKKPLMKAELKLSKDNEKKSYAREMADLILSKHKKGSLTLVVVNRVDRAQEIFKELTSKDRTERRTENDAAVLHSRFREGDRKARMQLLCEKQDRIIVATQVVEAGVDVSAHTLITELAPWPSLVQRIGRCNRRGEYQTDAQIFWVDIETNNEEGGLVLPYESKDLDIARNLIETIPKASASLEALAQAAEGYVEPEAVRAVVRRKDFIDLFDTTPDLTGNDLDVSRFIREGEDKDVQVYWRDGFSKEDGPKGALDPVRREELCSVSIGKIRDYLKKHNGWIWDHLEGKWKSVGESGAVNGCRPGQVLLLHPENGGYSPILGWVGIEGKTVASVEVIPAMESVRAKDDHSMNEDRQSNIGSWVTLKDHTDHVNSEVQALSESLNIPDHCRTALCEAAIWHDVGKAHQAFQNMLLSGKGDDGGLKSGGPWAKSDGSKGRPYYWVISSNGNKIERTYFRHELASALAWLQTQGKVAEDADLVAYLIAAHHGKIRMSIRSLDKEKRPRQADRLFARGIWDGDVLSQVEGILDQDLPLDLSIMQMGEGSWLERMTALRDQEALGPLRLALLESILRIADWRASAKEEKKMVVG
ncbi:MAG: CRISPR-associated helicase Cas3 [Methanosaeta sp. PtaU1.Bin112]|nr:MAG: CRISPR-associated helicase Cas3 [Methanosaeta sp. PtaU1.Bin112]